MDGNSITLEGNMTRDLVVRTLPSGTIVGSGSIARSGKTREGKEWGPEFYDFDVWGEQALNVEASTGKGTRIVLSGSLRHQTWDAKDSDGNVIKDANGKPVKRSKHVVRADSVNVNLRWAQAQIEKVARPAADSAPDEDERLLAEEEF